MPKNALGVDTRHKPPTICMVVGCPRKALYRTGNKQNKSQARGYCSAHRELALPRGAKYDRKFEAAENYFSDVDN